MVKHLTCGSLSTSIYQNRTAMGVAATRAGITALKQALDQYSTINVMFAAAPSQEEVLHLLSESDLDWSRVNAFHMDDYVGLAANAPQRFSNFLRQRLFNLLPFRSINCMQTVHSVEDAEVEAERYGALLHAYPISVCFMGIGENGHIAFNDPPVADFHDPQWVKVVALDETCRIQQVHDGCFASLADVPTHAMTVTIPALFSAEHIICTVPGSTKAGAVKNLLSGAVDTTCPASILTTHKDAQLFLDMSSASLVL